MIPLVELQRAEVRESTAANITPVWFLLGVHTPVLQQTVPHSKGCTTLVTAIRLLSGVRSNVTGQMAILSEAGTALGTGVWWFRGVRLTVHTIVPTVSTHLKQVNVRVTYKQSSVTW